MLKALLSDRFSQTSGIRYEIKYKEVVFAENNALVQIHQIFERVHAAEGERPAAIAVQSSPRSSSSRAMR